MWPLSRTAGEGAERSEAGEGLHSARTEIALDELGEGAGAVADAVLLDRVDFTEGPAR
jgi:hypothetical protein